ncbi:MAG: TM2 domain-containing protein [Coraliomargarita sp.]
MADKPAGAEKKIAAGICGILLGGLGIHKFILGYTKEGVIMLLVCLLGSLILVGPMIMGLIGLIEGILYLTKSDEDFVATYVNGKKGWF